MDEENHPETPNDLWTDWNTNTHAVLGREYEDAGHWGRHYSAVRMTLGTFFLGGAVGLISLRWDKPDTATAWWAAAIAILGVVLFVWFSTLTFVEMNKQLAIVDAYRRRLAGKGVPKRYSLLWELNALPLAIVVLIVFLIFDLLWRFGGQHESTRQPQPASVGSTWPLFGVCAVAIAAGAALMIFGRSLLVRLAGLGAIAGGLTAHGYLIKEIKIGEIFKLQNQFDVSAKITAELKKLGGFGPEPLAQLDGFDPGRSKLQPTMLTKITDVCRSWRDRAAKGQDGLLLVIGSTDRVPLRGEVQTQYESNFGLARARAERVRSAITGCGVPDSKLLALVSGPRNTPEGRRQLPAGADTGYAEDRRVDVWAFWNLGRSDGERTRSIDVTLGKNGPK